MISRYLGWKRMYEWEHSRVFGVQLIFSDRKVTACLCVGRYMITLALHNPEPKGRSEYE